MEMRAGPFTLSLDRPLVMGVVNVTPDSFSDGGQFRDARAAIAHATRLVEEGADLLDIGGESSRPGATSLAVEEELRRVLPVLEGCVSLGVPVSVDTYKARVMRESVKAGAAMLNDIWAFQARAEEPDAWKAACDAGFRGVALCAMHMQRNPQTMQTAPMYEDVGREVKAFLGWQVERFVQAGVPREQLVVDPGFGFGKTVEHNLTLLRRLHEFLELEVPVLVGLSRKSTIGTITGRPDPADRLGGSVSAALIAAMKGAKILRVHDVKETADALKFWNVFERRSRRS
jgi:dihydropteroate synthase